jgi:hypothetical protein
VIPGAHDEIDLHLHHIGFFSVEADLVAALIKLAVVTEHGEIAIRCLVIKGIELSR